MADLASRKPRAQAAPANATQRHSRFSVRAGITGSWSTTRRTASNFDLPSTAIRRERAEGAGASRTCRYILVDKCKLENKTTNALKAKKILFWAGFGCLKPDFKEW